MPNSTGSLLKMRKSCISLYMALSLLPSVCHGFASTVSPPPPTTIGTKKIEAANDWESVFPPDDETCLVDLSEEATVDHILQESAVSRALEISGIVFSKILFPLSASVMSNGLPDNWNDFWAQASIDDKSNAQHVTEALEDLGPVYVKFGTTCIAAFLYSFYYFLLRTLTTLFLLRPSAWLSTRCHSTILGKLSIETSRLYATL